MKRKRTIVILVALMLSVFTVLTSCNMQDVEYANYGSMTDVATDYETIITDIMMTYPLPQTTPNVPVATTCAPGCRCHPSIFSPVEPPENGIIETAGQLHAVLIKGDPTADYTVVAKELDMSNYTWDGMKDYSGTFDFGGCVIKNAIDSLFVSVDGGTVKNLVLADAKYVYSHDDASEDINPKTGDVGNMYYSPIVRYANDITMSNVTVEPSVTVHSDIWFENSAHGGLVGYAEGSNIVIEDCTFAGEYTTDSIRASLGGIAGYIASQVGDTLSLEDPENSSVLLNNCLNLGAVNNLGYGMDSKVGGIVGWLGNGAAIGCGNYGNVSSNDNGQTAGVVGYLSNAAYIQNCINAAIVKGNYYVGGICGYSNGADRYFENCVNLGSIQSYLDHDGGIAGLLKGQEKLINCFNLDSTCEAFAKYKLNDEVVIDPANVSKDIRATLTNCADLSSIVDLCAKLLSVAPSMLEMIPRA